MLAETPMLANEPRTAAQAAHRYAIACALAFCVAALYITVIIRLDNTNVGTSNGLWKSPLIDAWEHGTAHPTDGGQLIYLPAYGYLSRLIPDSTVQYGSHGPMVAFRKMAILNALAGALASGFVFLLAIRFLGLITLALTISLMHASAAFVVLNSINSEDIAPGYACFVASVTFFFEYLTTRQFRFLPVSTFFVTFAMLLHWTLIGPALIAFGAAQLFLLLKSRRYIWLPVCSIFLFLLSIKAILLLSSASLSILTVLYPAKATSQSMVGWMGFRPDKALFELIGIGNYFSGGYNIGSYAYAFEAPLIIRVMSVSWAYCIFTVGACIWAFLSLRTDTLMKTGAAFALGLFAAGELSNLFVQPQDPQFQIEPMFATTIGLILLGHGLKGRMRGKTYRLITGALILGALCNGALNVRMMAATGQTDSESYRITRQLEQLFPPDTTTIIWHGFEGWTTWQFIVTFHADSEQFLKHALFLAGSFTHNPGFSAHERAALMREQIDAEFTSGRRVVAFALWTKTRRDFIASLSTLTDTKSAETYYDEITGAYGLGQQWETPAGLFVELLPKHTGNDTIRPSRVPCIHRVHERTPDLKGSLSSIRPRLRPG